jgi:hypothetical protein
MNRIKSTVVVLVILSLTSTAFSLPSVWGIEDSWATLEPLPLALAGFKAAAVNDKIYVMKLNITYEYDLCSWSTKKSMPTSRDSFGIVAYQNKIYCIGGRTNYDPSATNEVYNPESDSWETKTAMPTPRLNLDANLVNGKIYLIGGVIQNPRFLDVPGTYVRTNVTEVYDPVTDSWVTKAPIPFEVSLYASAVVENKIYVISESLTQIYDPKYDTWSFGTPPRYPVDLAGGVATTGEMAPERIYVIGGRKDGLEIAYTQIYDPTDDSWSLGTQMPTPRYDFATAVVNDQIYAMGGVTGAFAGIEQKNQNEQYTPFSYIPEFPSWTPLLIMLGSVLVVAVIYRRMIAAKNQGIRDQ